jgi:hypothetical protein
MHNSFHPPISTNRAFISLTLAATILALATTITIKAITSHAVIRRTTQDSQRIIRTFGRYAIISITCSGCALAVTGMGGRQHRFWEFAGISRLR